MTRKCLDFLYINFCMHVKEKKLTEEIIKIIKKYIGKKGAY